MFIEVLSNFGHDCGGAFAVRVGQRVVDLVVVAAIDGGGGPAKGGEFSCQVAKFYGTGVVVDGDAGEIGEVTMRGLYDGLPDAALVAFAIADEREDAPVALFEAQGQRHSYRHRQTVTQ